MPLTPGSRIGSYEIVSLLGAGGMGEVYRARDTTLNRDVALKLLPEAFAGDADRLARFKREAQVLASLNHPNIAAIYGIERNALVMELVEGEDLSAHIARGALPMAEALPIARQIADALEAAHEQGIVHRDLKPANVKIRRDGTVKVLDFGLAKAVDPPGTQSGDAMNSPTMTARATAMGMILGTAAYMSPEQARGKPIDRRADIWAFGAVLYEMLAGRRLFEGGEITDVLAAVLRQEKDWSGLPAGTPPQLRRLLERCLDRDVKQRLQAIGEARVTIDAILAGEMDPPPVPPPAPASRPAWISLLPWALAGAIAVAAAVPHFRVPTAAVVLPMHVEITLPTDVELFSGPSLSADGQRIAFIGVRLGVRQVYTRSLQEIDARAIPGTETATTVALSPDGTEAAFVSNDTKLRRVSFTTAVVEPLADGLSVYSGPSWASDGSIVFSRGKSLALRQRDGRERQLATLDEAAAEFFIGWPVVVAGDKTVLFVSRRRTAVGISSRIEEVQTAGGHRRVVLDGADQVVFASADRVLFQKDGALYLAPFSPGSDAALGTPVRLEERSVNGQIGGVAASVSASGALALAPPTVLDSHLVWVSADGAERPIRGSVRGFLNPRVSPDGRRIAFSEAGSIWTLDPERNTFTRVTNSNEPSVGFPLWSADGKHLYYRSTEGIRIQSAEGEGASNLLPNTAPNDYPGSITPDGNTMVLLRLAPDTAGDLYTTPAAGGPVTPLLVTRDFEGGAQVSPDGKWLLYISNKSGRMEVMLRPFKGPDRTWSVSTEGGIHATWSPDGKHIYYRNGQQFLQVDVTTTPDVRLGVPKVLFDKRFAFGQNISIPNYSMSADGREFLLVQDEPGGRHLNLIFNWLQTAGKQ